MKACAAARSTHSVCDASQAWDGQVNPHGCVLSLNLIGLNRPAVFREDVLCRLERGKDMVCQ